MKVERVSAITLVVRDMRKAVDFYGNVLGLKMIYGGSDSSFTSFDVNGTFLNLEAGKLSNKNWGRVIFYVDNVDELFDYLKKKGFEADEPRDAKWGERYFHVRDPDGHEISFAKPIE